MLHVLLRAGRAQKHRVARSEGEKDFEVNLVHYANYAKQT